ncbi:hypothetical protein C490_04402 [Natronobacterium gregoryi SP2]|uniref:Uncharacterized protein n=1 Tax=Natronobacterium gregoryi (strain ATCC 43098 / DSM 3393 / CCM 3738 / CIP 104747 / IAM 13177 / JCM 8860 / NBRC 102187 / NCIMB 2189 / SP2) TaxID=797304 RepID=L9YD13_NATGS|nr:hypothetical protein C490_04402 [Natronobacterium gregoryi SP2]
MDIRKYITSLSSDSGRYYLVCARTGDRPVPTRGLSFESRSTARAAARATEQYRTTLRRYDPRLPSYDVVVCERSRERPADGESTGSPRLSSTLSTPVEVGAGRNRMRSAEHSPDDSLIDFCHTVAAAVFETIAESSHDDLEKTIMDTYVDLAERIEQTNELCLCLLESMAAELATTLTPDEQRRLLSTTVQRLPPAPSAADPIASTLSRLQTVSLLEGYAIRSRSGELETGVRAWTVSIDGYAFDGATKGENRPIVTLPLTLELFRQYPTRQLTISDVERPESDPATCRVRITTESVERSPSLVQATEVTRR